MTYRKNPKWASLNKFFLNCWFILCIFLCCCEYVGTHCLSLHMIYISLMVRSGSKLLSLYYCAATFSPAYPHAEVIHLPFPAAMSDDFILCTTSSHYYFLHGSSTAPRMETHIESLSVRLLVSLTIGWMGMKCFEDIHCPLRIKTLWLRQPFDFFSTTCSKSYFFSLRRIFTQPYDGLV